MRIEASLLPDGRRLHLHQGPIDLIIEAFGSGRNIAYERAVLRFDGLLQELVDELPALRGAADQEHVFKGSVARRMQSAVVPYVPEFVTPMAAVAGAVADEILDAMSTTPDIDKIYVNNGGDVAFSLAPGQKMEAVMAATGNDRIVIDSDNPCRGVATSGWRGRSLSLGIADSVSVLADTAAEADVAATMIANAIDLPGHPAIKRLPACEADPDSDLGARLVTEDVGPLSSEEIVRALDRGDDYARSLVARNMVAGTVLTLQDHIRHIGPHTLLPSKTGELAHA